MASSAAAKLILLGEHAVVYGQPAIAVPLSSLRAYADYSPSDRGFEIVARDLDQRVIDFDADDPLMATARLTLDQLGQVFPSIRIDVHSDIPIASGLGSGAAISAAIVRCLCDYFQMHLADGIINDIVYEVETYHHGTPSGIDNTVVVYEKAIYFVRGEAIRPITVRKPMRLLVADTGQRSLTKVAVGDVKRLVESQPQATQDTLDRIGVLVELARETMQQGNWLALGKLMTENHLQLQALTVSSPELDRLVKVALDAGAWGAKLSGGGRGGNMIALVSEASSSTVRQALQAAGAVRVFETVMGA